MINIQFGLSDATPLYTGQAKLGGAGQTWNLYDADDDIPPVSLNYASGTSSAAFVTVEFNTIGVINRAYDRFSGTPDDPLMKYYALSYVPSAVDFIHLTPRATYTLYVYSQQATNAVNPSTIITVSGKNYTLSNPTSTSPKFVSGMNYIAISGVQSDALGNLTFTYSPGNQSQIGVLNGIQLLQTSGSYMIFDAESGSPIPEPSKAELTIVGIFFVAGSVFFRRSKRSEADVVLTCR